VCWDRVCAQTNGRVQICVDLTKSNLNICRERLILPSVEQILAQLGGTTVFSKLAEMDGQVEVA